jgi:hypothetical protein
MWKRLKFKRQDLLIAGLAGAAKAEIDSRGVNEF